MGNRMICATTPKTTVAQSSANTSIQVRHYYHPLKGGGGSAAHLHAKVVAQSLCESASQFSLRLTIKIYE